MVKATLKAVEQLKRDEEVKAALEDVQPSKQAKPRPARVHSRLWWLGGAFAAFGLAYAANAMVGEGGRVQEWIGKGLMTVMAILLLSMLEQTAEVYTLRRLQDNAARFNLRRVLRLVAALLIVGVGIKILIVNWYTAFASLGLASLILGFALQTPITSFIGWIYILTRKPYRVGDRIRIGESTGDVIDVSYLDTTLWEFGGEYLSTDHPSGRIIKFPNSSVLNAAVYNYSWPLFPYIWNEIKLNVAYESDLDFVADVMRDVATKELGDAMVRRVATFRKLLAETPVDELTVKEHPSVFFRPSENTWIEAIVRYLVEPKEAGRVKSLILKETLIRLNAAPERVLFPKSNMR